MKIKLAALAAYALLALLIFGARAVLAQFPSPDFPALPDGGSLVTGTGALSDGGNSSTITVDTGQTEDWTATVRCRSSLGSPRVYARWSADAGAATSANQLYEVDRTFDFTVRQPGVRKLRWISFLGEDGGPPNCNVQTQVGP